MRPRRTMDAIIYIIHSHRFAESTRLLFGLSVSLFLLVCLACRARAHDPGLSSAMVTVGDEQIDVLLGFAQKDAESMLSAHADQPAADAPLEMRSEISCAAQEACSAISKSWSSANRRKTGKSSCVPTLPSATQMFRIKRARFIRLIGECRNNVRNSPSVSNAISRSASVRTRSGKRNLVSLLSTANRFHGQTSRQSSQP